MPSAGFQTVTSATKRPLTYALDRTVTEASANFILLLKIKKKNVSRFTHPLHRDEERVREETGCVLSGGQKHSVGTELCTAVHRAFGVEAYFKDNKSIQKNHRSSAVISVFIATTVYHRKAR
jgi:hypothetical protein